MTTFIIYVVFNIVCAVTGTVMIHRTLTPTMQKRMTLKGLFVTEMRRRAVYTFAFSLLLGWVTLVFAVWRRPTLLAMRRDMLELESKG
jgi:hypothetical protein